MLWSVYLAACAGSEREPSRALEPTTEAPPPTEPTAPTETPNDTDAPTTDAPIGALRFIDGNLPDNLLILSVDTTRRDFIGRFSGNGLTPNLDEILAQAVVLEDHRSCSNWTAPSMTCVVTGRTQMEQDFGTWNGDDEVPNVPGTGFVQDTLARHMSDLGKHSLLLTANWVFGPWGTRVGVGYDLAIDVDQSPAAVVVDRAMDEIPVMASQGDFYAHVHFMDPHGNYCAPEALVDQLALAPVGLTAEEWCADSYGPGGGWWYGGPAEQAALVEAYLALYTAEMVYWDTELGLFWDRLDSAGLLDDTLVVFVTDHGQQFFERGGHGHGIYLGAEENRSTAAFWAKNLEPVAWSGPTVHQDVNATINAVFGITPIAPRSGVVVGTAPPDRAIRVINYWGGGSPVELGVIRDGQQLNYDFNGNRAFFRYADDPLALTDTYDSADPDVIARWVDMASWVAEVQAQWPHLTPVQAGP